jgi:hypothetical protein
VLTYSNKKNTYQKKHNISELLDFLIKESFVKKLKEKVDKDYSSFITLIESLINQIPDLSILSVKLENSIKYLTFIKDLSGNNEITNFICDININEIGIFKKMENLESKISFLERKLEEKNKVEQMSKPQNVIGEIRMNLDSNNAYANDEYSILSGIEYLLSNNNAVQCLKLIKWRKRIIEIANSSGWIVAKILASNTMKKFEVNENDIIEANLTFMEQYSHVQQNLKASDSSTNLITLYEKELISSINNLIEEDKKK